MKGKIAFVLGAAVGYVLGTRAGRERYEQIKNGAQNLWHTAPVQRGVSVVRDAAQTRLDDLKASATRAGKNAVAAFLRDDEPEARPASRATASATAAKAVADGEPRERSASAQSGASAKKSSSGTAKSSKSTAASKSTGAAKKRSSGAAAKSGDDA